MLLVQPTETLDHIQVTIPQTLAKVESKPMQKRHKLVWLDDYRPSPYGSKKMVEYNGNVNF